MEDMLIRKRKRKSPLISESKFFESWKSCIFWGTSWAILFGSISVLRITSLKKRHYQSQEHFTKREANWPKLQFNVLPEIYTITTNLQNKKMQHSYAPFTKPLFCDLYVQLFLTCPSELNILTISFDTKWYTSTAWVAHNQQTLRLTGKRISLPKRYRCKLQTTKFNVHQKKS